ncbi:hypothetical protein INR49_032241, partial [Caranx melampygus]
MCEKRHVMTCGMTEFGVMLKRTGNRPLPLSVLWMEVTKEVVGVGSTSSSSSWCGIRMSEWTGVGCGCGHGRGVGGPPQTSQTWSGEGVAPRPCGHPSAVHSDNKKKSKEVEQRPEHSTCTCGGGATA